MGGWGGSMGKRYVTIFKKLASLAVSIRQIARLIVKPFFYISKAFQRQTICVQTEVCQNERNYRGCTCQRYEALQGGGGLKNVQK